MNKMSKRVVALLTMLILLIMTVGQVAFAADADASAKRPKVELVLSEPDADGYLTASLMIYDAFFSGAQFGFSFDNEVLQFVDSETKEASEEFSNVSTIYNFENENGEHKFTTLGCKVSNEEGILKIGVYGMPSAASDNGARITVGEEGFKLADISMKALKKEDPSFEILAYKSATHDKEAILADGESNISLELEFVIPEYFGVENKIIAVETLAPKKSMETMRKERLVDSLILNIGNYAAVDDGYLKWIDESNKNVVPFIEGDRTYLPLRFIGEAFGADVNWNPDNQEITLNLNDNVVIMNIGKQTYTVNGEEKTMDVAPFIKEDRTFVPVRYIGEALSKDVYWDAALKLVIVTPVENPWNPEGEAEKNILPDALLIMSALVRDLYADTLK